MLRTPRGGRTVRPVSFRDASEPQRILVYGVCGSGKTTLARRLAERSGLPWHSVDELTWEPGWVEVPLDEQRRRIERICQQQRWILDTAYGQWLDVPLAHAELIVGLDYPRLVSLARLVGRTLRRIVDQKPICNGNHESLRTLFASDSIVVWHFRSFARKRRRMRAWAADPNGPDVLLFSSPRHAAAWVMRQQRVGPPARMAAENVPRVPRHETDATFDANSACLPPTAAPASTRGTKSAESTRSRAPEGPSGRGDGRALDN